MENTTEIRTKLASTYDDLIKGKITTQVAQEIVRICNAMLKSAAIEADYNKYLGKNDEISFLKTKS